MYTFIKLKDKENYIKQVKKIFFIFQNIEFINYTNSIAIKLDFFYKKIMVY